MSELTKLQKISTLSKDLMNKKMNDTDRFVHLSHIHELAEELQPELNENQLVVLDWLKNDMLDDSDFYNTIYNSRFLHVNGEPHRKENIAFMKLKNKELAQVIQAFSQWAIEQEEE
ncbi:MULTISPECIES: hypothetical protein [Enterococcus]|uniref:hypothetical protein n=1 Tax=Enterococcus TaxID=1350 RepID=UPI0009CBE130|nr:hypothetical protein [Enterococcus faecalis]EHL2480153.1 hypothetical protein [Enterococcus faecalis]EHR4406924.1 hypothetical protein [Enterococcus faecalis]EHU8862582.1 hypothetical protein [Enterococcus faecalis]EHZ9323654.1 hypothetical protein [Enterococcus faecalis]EIB6803851.1 hypothetical protein [Enterococcus faecalis]